MESLKFKKGLEENLPKDLEKDTIYITTDTKKILLNDAVWEDTENIKSELPTKTSDLTNDSGFITINDVPVLEIPEEYVTEGEIVNFVEVQDTNAVIDDVETNTYVKYVAQTLTEEQKAQVRNNIDAPSMEQLITMYQELLGMINNLQNQAPTVATLDKSVLDNTKLA